MEFKKFSKLVEEQFNEMAKGNLFVVDIDKNLVWEKYLVSFPEGTNSIRNERGEHDCQYCRQFIKNIGNVVAIVDNKLVSIWDVTPEGYYNNVATALSDYIKSAKIKSIFRHNEAKVGIHNNKQQLESGEIITWNHFACVLPSRFVTSDKGAVVGAATANRQVFGRGLEEITREALDTVLEFIAQDSIYRGAEHKTKVMNFDKLHLEYSKLSDDTLKDIYIWENIDKPGARIRNDVIGTLLTDISDGMDINLAVKSFETKVAPSNYKRTSAVITKDMIDKAVGVIKELGIEDSLHRRFAVTEDISINNVIFADKGTPMADKDALTDLLMQEVKQPKQNFDKVEEIGIEEFIENVVPKADSIEVFVGNQHKSNLVSLVSPKVAESPNILLWDNNFTWSYNGDITDSMKELVKTAGGVVDGDLRISLGWHNSDDLDLHIHEPDGNRIYHGKKNSSNTGGTLDVDMNAGGLRNNLNPVENVIYVDKTKMTKGRYEVHVNQYNKRNNSDVGYSIEIEFGGKVNTFTYDKLATGKKCVCVINFDGDSIEFENIGSEMTTDAKSLDVWGIKTEQFKKLSTLMYSPNHWDTNEVGNKHYFFMLEDCVNPEKTRGLYNEFLSNGLTEHRKVFDMLGEKMKCESDENQLSGLGFSSTVRNELIVKVSGSFTRTLKVKF